MTRTAHAPSSGTEALARSFRRPLLMGVINRTPDSFHESGRSSSVEAAVERGLLLAEEGADLLDVGGQSTRPGSEPVSLDEERARVIPVVAALAKKVKIPISVDTDKALIAREALDAGAKVLNDVTALRGDKDMMKAAVRFDRVVLMHMLGEPRSMQKDPKYRDCAAEVRDFLAARLDAFAEAGGRADRVWIDPGIGFGKTLEHNLELLRATPELSKVAPVLVGVSRKSMLSKISPDAGPHDRLSGSLAVAAWASLSGAAVLRVHDVLETRRLIETLSALAGKR